MTDTLPDQESVAGAAGQGPSFAVQSFTARFDPIEDRICLNVVDEAGQKQAIYLTRRLMDQIIPVVVKHLEDKTPKGIPADVVQSMTQERVRQVRMAEAPAEPVQADIETPRWLCTTVRMSKVSKGLTMTLSAEATASVLIGFDEQHLRTALDIFRNSYIKAGWDMRVFPDWQKSGPRPAVADGPNRLN